MTMQLALDVPPEVAPLVNQRDYDRMVAYNRDVFARLDEAHAASLKTGEALGAWVDAWTDDEPPVIEHPATIALHDIESFCVDCQPGDYTADVVAHTARAALSTPLLEDQ